MARSMFNRNVGSGGDFTSAQQGWYQISVNAGSAAGQQMTLFKTEKDDQSTRVAYFRFPVVTPSDEMLRYMEGQEIGYPEDVNEIPIRLIHPLDTMIRDEKGNTISNDSGTSTMQWLSKFGASLSGINLAQDDDDVWNDIVWLLRNGNRKEAIVNVWTSGWPSRGQGPIDKEVLAVFKGFQHFDYENKRPTWVLEKSNRLNSDGSVRYNHKVPVLFEIVAPSIMAGTILSYPFLNYTVIKVKDDDGAITFGGGGSNARFPALCSTFGVDIESVLASHEAEAMAILENDAVPLGAYIPEILDWVEQTALTAVGQGHLLHVRTDDRGYILMDQLNVASPAVIVRIGGEGFKLVPLVTIAQKGTVVAEQDPIVVAELAPVTVPAATSTGVDTHSLMPVAEVVKTYNGLAKQMKFEKDVCSYDPETDKAKFDKDTGRKFAAQALVPLFSYGPLGLDRKKGFELTVEANALILSLCFSKEYLDLAGQATNDNPFPGDLEARLGIALADIRGASEVEEEEDEGF